MRFFKDKTLKKCSCGGTPVIETLPIPPNTFLRRVFCVVCNKSTEYKEIGSTETWNLKTFST